MESNLLTIKLHELDKKLNAFYNQIRLSENSSQSDLNRNIVFLRNKCEEEELLLHKKICLSKAKIMSVFGEKYDGIEELASTISTSIDNYFSDNKDSESLADEKLLLAEYYLDFAANISQRALLCAMEAISAQESQEEEKECNN